MDSDPLPCFRKKKNLSWSCARALQNFVLSFFHKRNITRSQFCLWIDTEKATNDYVTKCWCDFVFIFVPFSRSQIKRELFCTESNANLFKIPHRIFIHNGKRFFKNNLKWVLHLCKNRESYWPINQSNSARRFCLTFHFMHPNEYRKITTFWMLCLFTNTKY